MKTSRIKPFARGLFFPLRCGCPTDVDRGGWDEDSVGLRLTSRGRHLWMKTFKMLCSQRRLIIRLFFHPLFGTAETLLASSGRRRETRNQKTNDTQPNSASSYKILPDRKWSFIVLAMAAPSLSPFPANVKLGCRGLPAGLGLQYCGNGELIFVLIPIWCQPNLWTHFITCPVFFGDTAFQASAGDLDGWGRCRTKTDD